MYLRIVGNQRLFWRKRRQRKRERDGAVRLWLERRQQRRIGADISRDKRKRQRNRVVHRERQRQQQRSKRLANYRRPDVHHYRSRGRLHVLAVGHIRFLRLQRRQRQRECDCPVR